MATAIKGANTRGEESFPMKPKAKNCDRRTRKPARNKDVNRIKKQLPFVVQTSKNTSEVNLGGIRAEISIKAPFIDALSAALLFGELVFAW